ncbi:Methionine aminopeptidase [Candidatus Providencia siddallii]|uniref:Methionine aminopeptidase n=1 Tax=Candidatus Providencia siddallii TaxID=1715285 RepID=A0A0M6W7G6_9GAMM|nr:Methionine aminopeptidase [Candidatus Providencia siddallii]
MSIIIKSEKDIQKMRIAGKLASDVLKIITPYIIPGVKTSKLDYICHKYIIDVQKAIPACFNYKGFPKSVCISVNDVICHGIPSDSKILRDGDIVNIDVTVIKDGFYGDTSKMFFVGNSTIQGKKLCQIAQNSLYLAILMVKPGIRLYTIGKAIQEFVEKYNLSIVREYCGHGIGRNFHEEPQVLHYESEDRNIILQEGMAFTIEPMVNFGDSNIRIMSDGWTVKTKDRSWSAQYEHTLVVTNKGCEILTLRDDEPFSSSVLINE